MDYLEVFSPFDGHKVGEVKFSTKDEVLEIIDRAYDIFTDFNKRLPKYKIVEILTNAAQIIEKNSDEIIKIAASEGGKPYVDSKVEVFRAIDGIKVAISHLSSMHGEEIAMGHTKSSENRMAFTFYEPIGVVASVSAFNHPFNLAVHQVIPAIAVGCPVIIKPASQTPLSAFKLIEILKQAGLPDGYASAIVCDRESTNLLTQSKKISFLSFIGSSDVGWMLAKNTYPGVRCALEHGGVAPVIINNDVNLDEIAILLLKGGFYHAGQVCVSVQRIFVHEDIARKLANKLAEGAKKLKVGDPLDESVDVGPIINNKELERIDSWVREAKDSGAEILCGGNKDGSCYQPTVIFNPSQDLKVSTKEVFGPVICLYPYKDVDEAIKLANSLEVSFQAAVFSKNIDFCLKSVKKLNATTVMVNDHSAFRVDWMPFGGAKTSGIGVGGINYSMDEMCNKKLVVIKSSEIF